MNDLPVNKLNFCPECGGKNITFKDDVKWVCSDCGFTLYNNVAAAVGLVLYDDDNNVLFEVRQKNPGKGQLSLIGGFVDNDETAEHAVVRECMEEIGFDLKAAEFLCTEPNTYPYKNIRYKTCDVYFTAKIPAGEGSFGKASMHEFIKSLKPQEGEVTSLVCHQIKSEEDIEKLPIAFESARLVLKAFVARK